ncbi:hypothetical protein [Pseudoblastomonas flavescens]|uniref:hypothetical protein n=1 Tax=Alteriqipengyuania flavescens TaxID=3053610 RepID=UPI0025B4D875|nr:hypothetical protein [Alteriqipengyuania flavescens]WJY18693.1 hypothetical protein QQW98_00110 [Alteriqipengyuania flavescens]
MSLKTLFADAQVHHAIFHELLDQWSAQGWLVTYSTPLRIRMTDEARARSAPPATLRRVENRRLNSMRARMWSAMRVLRAFDLPTLCFAAEVSQGNARTFLRDLVRVGYATEIGSGMRAGWKLAKDTGPTHPIIRTIPNRAVKGLLLVELRDRNTGTQTSVRVRATRSSRKTAGAPSRRASDGGVG